MPRNKRVVTTVAALAGLITVGSIAATAAIPAPTPNGFTQDRSAELAKQINPAKPRNVILIIGDGMDDSMITAARNYEYGAGGRFPALDALPFTGAMTTYGLKVGSGPDYPIAYVSDSAPTASGWSTGKKTVDGRLSQGPSTASNVPGEDYETVLEKYKKQGKLVGNITTSEITDATPAAAASHINARACQGPTDMTNCAEARKVNGGKGSVAEQLVDNKVDVLMGGGASRYAQATDAGSSVLAYAQTTHKYRLVSDAPGLTSVTSLADGPVLGLFANGNLTPMYQPLVATAVGAGGPSTKCTPADRGNQPDLSAMMTKSIELLDNPNGFFLQAESAMIDKQEHASDICGAIGDLKELDETVAVALAYQEKHPDTLVVVTGDHAHSTQIVGGSADDGKQLATVQTADGDPMTVAYSTNAVGSDHTGAQIRVAASGPQAANVTGVIDQTDLFATLLGRTPSTMPGTPVTPGTPGTPGTPTPTPTPAKPAVSTVSAASIAKEVLARRGLRVAVAATGGQKVTIRLVKDGRTLVSKTLGSTGGRVALRTTKAKIGKVKVVATVTGAGGSVTDSQRVRVTR
ncbi:alkaline phosphatase [Nocardioides alpinus]|uniref:Alkaline phosphatase n=1 Tax=Nocardioides alpinus TaxID=748909 RepID=A0A1I1AJZ2_9ACTN|nr:alkaline phosphatase [Nocardioides alpinus]PKH41746.1 alkaline phosphatase [Nocardioides alpinus]SFB38345.1 alkaline phosphatase [Nocardioides alpinus]